MKELTCQDAAALIQVTFRAHLVRRSKALRELRELAIAKSKLKEIRALFHNFSYRRHLASDAEERQRFSEKIIVLLLTVDAIEVQRIAYLAMFFICLQSFSSATQNGIFTLWNQLIFHLDLCH